MPTIQMDLFPGLLDDNQGSRNQTQAQNQSTRTQTPARTPAQAGRNNPNIRTPQTTQRGASPSTFSNPFLDDDEPAPVQQGTPRAPNNMPATVPRDARSQFEESQQDYSDIEDEMDLPPLYDYDGLPSWNPLD
jgi:hypothetical protein